MLEKFGRMIARRRLERDWSASQVTRMLSVPVCLWQVESGKLRPSKAAMRQLAALLGIADIEAWIVALHGVEGPIAFEKAQRICDLLGIEGEQIDARPLLAKAPKRIKCTKCNHEWAQRRTHKPAGCPNCGTIYYDRAWTPEMRERSRRRSAANKKYWAALPAKQRRKEVMRRVNG